MAASVSHNETTQNPALRQQEKAMKQRWAHGKPTNSLDAGLKALARLPGVSVLCMEGLCPDLHGQIPSSLCSEPSKEQNHQDHPRQPDTGPAFPKPGAGRCAGLVDSAREELCGADSISRDFSEPLANQEGTKHMASPKFIWSSSSL